MSRKKIKRAARDAKRAAAEMRDWLLVAEFGALYPLPDSNTPGMPKIKRRIRGEGKSALFWAQTGRQTWRVEVNLYELIVEIFGPDRVWRRLSLARNLSPSYRFDRESAFAWWYARMPADEVVLNAFVQLYAPSHSGLFSSPYITGGTPGVVTLTAK